MFPGSFRGGIHPNDHKEQTKEVAVKKIKPGEILTYLLSQGGRGCTPLVQKGDRVLKGQLIADSNEFLSAPIHASVSGTVEKIEKVITQKGDMADAIIVRNDFAEESVELHPIKPEGYITKEELVKEVRKAGIVGMGGAGFPTHVKLATDKKIDTIIVNGSECEPYLTSDYRVLREKPEAMIDGLDIVIHAYGVKNAVIAIEDNKKDVVPSLTKKLKSSMKIKVLKTKYPQGSEKQLIHAVTGRVVPEGGLPADVGVLVLNVDTMASISRAIRQGLPITRRTVTISGKAVKNPGNYFVRIGMSFEEIFEAAGGFVEKPAKLITGGPMMGGAIYSLKIPFTKTNSGILALTEEELGTKDEVACIRCGRCVEACPMGLMPVSLTKCIKEKDWEKAKKSGLMSCIECGCCAYTCPSDRNPVAVIRRGKNAIRNGK